MKYGLASSGQISPASGTSASNRMSAVESATSACAEVIRVSLKVNVWDEGEVQPAEQ